MKSQDDHQPGEAVLVGLIGAGIGASRTPGLHEREGARLGLRTIYKLIDLDVLGLDVRALPDLLLAAQRLGFAGLNITHPCKQAVIPLLDALSPDAEAIGAVNTVVLRDGRRVGHNTDWSGFAESFRRELPDVARDRVVLLGAGGGGAAVAYALLTENVGRLRIVDVDAERAGRLAASLAARFGAGRVEAVARIESALEEADGLVNTTPMGMANYPGSACPPALLHPGLWVADIVYFPMETDLLAQAQARGCRTMAGGGMAVFQAVGAFALFSGRTPDATRMMRDFASSCR
jgi:shikimate dehydrogenase